MMLIESSLLLAALKESEYGALWIFMEALIKSSAKIAPSDFAANWTKEPPGAGLRGRPLAAGEKHRPRRQPRLY